MSKIDPDANFYILHEDDDLAEYDSFDNWPWARWRAQTQLEILYTEFRPTAGPLVSDAHWIVEQGRHVTLVLAPPSNWRTAWIEERGQINYESKQNSA